MKGYVANIEEATNKNGDFRRVLYTGENIQLVLMSLKPGEEIGMEVHEDNDQFLRFESGDGKVIIDGIEHVIREDFAVVVPAGAHHNVINTSKSDPLKLYTLYGPPHHINGTIHKTKKDADEDDEEFDGVKSE
jgi:mannose-6-phosphate isomerase-like protein (cupin superfamily)